MSAETVYLIGQIFGFVAVGLTLLTYLMKTPLRLLTVLSGSVIAMILNYALLGAWSGMYLNVVCLIRNIVLMFAVRYPVLKGKAVSAGLCLLMFGVGVFSWLSAEGSPFVWINLCSWLVTVALTTNTYFLTLGNNTKLRYSIFFTSTLVLVYNVIVSSWGGVLNEAVAIASAAIGTLMYMKNKTPADQEP